MATRMQLQHYRRLAAEAEAAARPMPLEEVAYSVATGCECHECTATDDGRPTPAPVPSLVTVAGGRAVVVAGAVVDVIAYSDPWGDGR